MAKVTAMEGDQSGDDMPTFYSAVFLKDIGSLVTGLLGSF